MHALHAAITHWEDVLGIEAGATEILRLAKQRSA